MADSRDITGKNRKFTGTSGVKLPTGTTAQRVDEAGRIRFNSNTNLAEYYDGTDWKSIDAPPTITSFTLDGGSAVTSAVIARISGDASIVINGSNFDTTSATVVLEPENGGSNVSVASIARTNSSQFTITVTRTNLATANDPYAIKLTNGSGLAATLASAITANDLPAFATSADTVVASKFEGESASFSETTLAATDPEGDTITYSISAGALPPGVTINSSTAALEGTISGSSVQNYTFTVQAATSQGNTTRQFIFTITAKPFITATGGTITTTGNYKIHTFTSSANFVVSEAGTPSGSDKVDYLVVAGGGGGGGAGGGGGGFREAKSPQNSSPHSASPLVTTTGITLANGTYPIVVGGGGSAWPGSAANRGGNGGVSSFSTITSAGGGGGGTPDGYGSTSNGADGGSGGGAGQDSNTPGASGNTPPVSPPQGKNGGPAGPGGYGSGGGGGGATSAGQAGGGPGNPAPGGQAGNGATTSISNSSSTYSGGGGGGSNNSGSGSGGNGGPGGGGNGGGPNAAAGNPGSTNTGGGGGGGEWDGSGSTGGSGIVIIRYKYQ